MDAKQQALKDDARQRKRRREKQEEDKLASLLFGDGVVDRFGTEDASEDLIKLPTITVVDETTEAPALPDWARSRQAGTAAWVDEDDVNLSVKITDVNRLRKLRKSEEENVISGVEYAARLRSQHQQLHRSTDWADVIQRAEDEDQPSTLLQSSAPLLATSLRRLAQGTLNVARATDANAREINQSVVRSIEFHPGGQVVMTAGLDKTIRLFQLDGRTNPKIQGIHLPDMPIYKAKFLGDGSEIIAAGRRKYFYSINVAEGTMEKIPGILGHDEKSLESFSVSPDGKIIAFLGNDGFIILVSGSTKQWIADLKMHGSVRAAEFTPDSNGLISVGGMKQHHQTLNRNGEVYHWDLRTRTLILRHRDEGATHTTAVAISRDGQYFATGSDMGIVNVYDLPTVLKEAKEVPRPLKAIDNLTTSIHHLAFNADSQILAVSSYAKKSAMRLVHLPSCTVFQNWPTDRTPLNYVQCINFSPNSGYVTAGNDKGRALLFRLQHYDMA